MRRPLLFVLIGVLVVVGALLAMRTLVPSSPHFAKPPAYKPPEETAALAPGRDMDIAEATCSACHSVDYITTQPRQLADQKAFWTAEVTKMRSAYGLKTTDEMAGKIVQYLSETYR
jgi:cytochrome c5